MVKLAIIGDVHLHFSPEDVDYFNQSAYDLLLFVGDLCNYRPGKGVQIACLMARLQKPALFIPGNHDTVTLPQLAAEIWHIPLLAAVSSVGQQRRVTALRKALGNIVYCGYSTHPFTLNGHAFDVVAARPFSMGGPWLSFKPYLRRRYHIDSLAASAQRLQSCIDATASDTLLFLAHNGPTGLGSRRQDIWGCDFKPEEGDYGDPDLQQAIAYARSQGKRVLAVVAGHMHHHLKGAGTRRWLVQNNETYYVNAARVPRIFQKNGRRHHHHVAFSFDDTVVEVEERVVMG